MTDVEDLHQWIVQHMEEHPLYERLKEEEEVGAPKIINYLLMTIYPCSNPQQSDPITPKLYQSSEEGAKVVRNKGDHFLAIFRRL